jgi:SpoVK/Ycf46/Vps4 family AAA+-type ATPase
MQTNFLLQRLDRYQGILIVTTNARTRIDTAFERRMDVTVEFHAPDTAERWSLWQLHLPSHHSINSEFVEELAARCELTGGQIRNAALHASLLALNNGGIVTTAYLEAAARREYAKIGGVCPLRHVTEII